MNHPDETSCILVCVSTDPTPVQLIVQFLEQASKPSVNEQNQVQPPADNRRNRTLKLLALKVAAHMKWDLDVLEKGYVSGDASAVDVKMS